ncbi:MAG: hypothetical protein QXV23_02115 [Candidatus Bathyarchaeia archaeon]
MPEDIVEKARRKLEEHERQRQEAAQTIDLKDLVRKTRGLKSVYIDGYGELKYGSLTFSDLIEISKYQSNEERMVAIVYHMLKKAYPELTIEDVKSLPFNVSAKIIAALGKEEGFLTASS